MEGVAAPTVLPGAVPKTSDFNGDGITDFSDFLLFAQHFGARRGEAEFDTGYDLNIDGAVTFWDFLLFADSFTNQE